MAGRRFSGACRREPSLAGQDAAAEATPQAIPAAPMARPPSGIGATLRAFATSRRALGVAVRSAIVAIAGAIILLFVTGWNSWVGSSARQTTDDAYVRGDITPLSAKVAGYVRSVAVDDFQLVKTRDVLIEIEDQDYAARVAQAEADLLGADAAIANLKSRKALQHAEIDQAENVIVATQADLQRAQQELTRQRTLLATSYGTQQKVEQAEADAKRLAATVERNRAELEAARRQMAVLDTQESQLRADYKAKKALLDLARINLGYTRITAPIDGMVGERGVRAGQYVHEGTQVISVIPLQNVWVIANFKETQLTHIQPGEKAEIRVDTFPGTVMSGHVERIAPASGSQFSLLPPDNATGNFTKVVQRIPVKIVLDDPNPLAGKLRPGMSVVATVIIDDRPPPH
jgi:membrane fusion protein (multidrug efflux system)